MLFRKIAIVAAILILSAGLAVADDQDHQNQGDHGQGQGWSNGGHHQKDGGGKQGGHNQGGSGNSGGSG